MFNNLFRSTHILHSPVSPYVCTILPTHLTLRKGFMSSVDLHTHSGFQRMLPESFAVVCAPKFTPKCVPISFKAYVRLKRFVVSFGIFRLTDPPGLHTILECTVKEAFHPHPDVPIYTVRRIGSGYFADLDLSCRTQTRGMCK